MNLLDSNTTNIFKKIFIIPIEDVYKISTWSSKSADIAKTSSNFDKKFNISIPDKLTALDTDGGSRGIPTPVGMFLLFFHIC